MDYEVMSAVCRHRLIITAELLTTSSGAREGFKYLEFSCAVIL